MALIEFYIGFCYWRSRDLRDIYENSQWIVLIEVYMTTIAWDGKTLASDSQSQVGNMITSTESQKIYNPQHGKWVINSSEIIAIGIAGDTSCIDEVISKLLLGINYETEFSSIVDFCLIAVTTKGSAYGLSKDKGDTLPSIFKVGDMFTIGSGDTYAMAAMKSGKTAKEAVEVAISLDVYSGGEIQEFSL